MKRSVAGVIAAAVLVTGLTCPASPASAHTETCVGSGTFHTNPVYSVAIVLLAPGAFPSATGQLTSNFMLGGCLIGGHLTFNGTFTTNAVGNFCEHSTGTLTVGTDALHWVNVGLVWVLSSTHGGGVLVVEPSAFTGHSCFTGATEFVWTGSIFTA